jgi:ATP-binding cassette subfamily D (ALD) long-chain fatty acid import protein
MAIFSKLVSSTRQKQIPIFIALAVVLLARSRLAGVAETVKRPLRSEKASAEDLRKSRQQLYFDEPDKSKTLLLPFQNQVSKVWDPPIPIPSHKLTYGYRSR